MTEIIIPVFIKGDNRENCWNQNEDDSHDMSHAASLYAECLPAVDQNEKGSAYNNKRNLFLMGQMGRKYQ